MTKKLLLSAFAAACTASAGAQITITSADMPALGDTFRYSNVDIKTNMKLFNTGANVTWVYNDLIPQTQGVDGYVTVKGAGYDQSGIDPGAFGFRVADSLSFSGSPATLRNIYTFFSNNAARYAAVGFAASVNGAIDVAAPYSDEDEWLKFPLTYGKAEDSTSFRFTATVLLGTVTMKGYRKTRVDGWGSILTPYLTSPVPALRVRSEVVEIDSVVVLGTPYGFPRHTVEYQWLTNSLRYPALLVSTNVVAGQEQPTNIRFRDSYRRELGIGAVKKPLLTQLQVYPNPASGHVVRVMVPAGWQQLETALYDATGKLLLRTTGTDAVATETLPRGNYTIIVRSGEGYGVAQFVK